MSTAAEPRVLGVKNDNRTKWQTTDIDVGSTFLVAILLSVPAHAQRELSVAFMVHSVSTRMQASQIVFVLGEQQNRIQ